MLTEKLCKGTDVLFPRIGEIIGGSVREESYDKLLEEIHIRGMKEEVLRLVSRHS